MTVLLAGIEGTVQGIGMKRPSGVNSLAQPDQFELAGKLDETSLLIE